MRSLYVQSFINVATTMILSDINDHNAFAALPDWPTIVAFLQDPTTATCPAGRYDLDGDRLYAIVADDEPRDDVAPLEAHQQYIDVQTAISGSFEILWKPLHECSDVRQPYAAESDVVLFNDEPTTCLHITPGLAAVLYPSDAHAPQAPYSHVRKVIVKIRIS
jgi:YhcH/YjgK/YiaL family protein